MPVARNRRTMRFDLSSLWLLCDNDEQSLQAWSLLGYCIGYSIFQNPWSSGKTLYRLGGKIAATAACNALTMNTIKTHKASVQIL